MKRLLSISLVLVLLSGCSVLIPAKYKFPDSPPSLNKECRELGVTKNTEKLSEAISVISYNYGLYHECRAKVDGWIEWYNIQKKIYSELK